MIKRFLIFRFEEYSPRGGWNDYRASFDTLAEARTEFESEVADGDEHAQMVDLHTLEVIDER